MRLRLHLIPVFALTAAAVGIGVAAPAAADCNYSGGSTLCSSTGTVRGGSAPRAPPTTRTRATLHVQLLRQLRSGPLSRLRSWRRDQHPGGGRNPANPRSAFLRSPNVFRVTNRMLVPICAGRCPGSLRRFARRALRGSLNCSAADRAGGISASIAGGGLGYLFAHPDVDEFADRPRRVSRWTKGACRRCRTERQSQIKAEVQSIRQPLADMGTVDRRCSTR